MSILENLISMEKGYLGYKEESDGWTIFGEWYADKIARDPAFACADWCVMFQTYCMYFCGVPGSEWPYTSPQGSACYYLDKWLTERGFRTGADDMPRRGDIVLYSWTNNPDDPDHVGLVCEVTGTSADAAVMRVIEGNNLDSVAYRTVTYRAPYVVKTFRLPSLAECDYFPSLSFMLSRGSSGEAVELLQAGLSYRGYTCIVDGFFGAETESALKAYQTDVEIEVDGKAGTETFKYLMGGEFYE